MESEKITSSKELIAQLKAIDNDIESLALQKRSLVDDLNAKAKQKLRIKAELTKTVLEDDDAVIVSDHAIVRYLERIEGIDIEKLKKMIVGDGRIAQAVKTLSSGIFPSEDGVFMLIVKDKVVVTVIKYE
jgi:hypothetical protein